MRFLRLLLPVIVLAIAGGICYYLFWSQPDPFKMPRMESIPTVEAKPLERTSYQVWLASQGTVQARTESTLISEVRGRIIEVSPSFSAGGFFEKGDVLLQVDPRDYQTEVVVAEAGLVQAQLRLREEEAQAEQASVDWKRLHPDEAPNDLVLRMPYLQQAKANVASAQARVRQAQLDLERTTITAPYAGRILSKNVDVGQFISQGNALGQIYAVDYAEIRLPLSERQMGFMDIPESYRDQEDIKGDMPKVSLFLTVGNDVSEWQGNIVRAEGALDTRSRQLFVVAQVDNPYGKRSDGRPPLKVGSFVQARIEGKLLENVHVISRSLYVKNEYVVIVDENDQIRRRSIDIEWSDEDNLVVRSGFRSSDRLSITRLSFPVDGMEVAVAGKDGALLAEGSSAQERAGRFRGMMQDIDMEKVPEDLKKRLRQAQADGDRGEMRKLFPELQKYRKQSTDS